MVQRIKKMTMPLPLIVDRYTRFIKHLIYPFYKFKNHLPSANPMEWTIDLLFYFFDLLFIGELFILINLLAKKEIRSMNEIEKLIARNVFEDAILFDHVYIDEKATFLTRKHRFAYVSFNMINGWGSMRDDVFIHELMHVYQYQKFGFVYVYRAIKAQYSNDGYDYGGPKGLIIAKKEGKLLFDFNFEQQASIIEHYYAIKQSKDVLLDDEAINTYNYYVMQLYESPRFTS